MDNTAKENKYECITFLDLVSDTMSTFDQTIIFLKGLKLRQ